MLRRHQDDLMNYFSLPIHNGTVEGLNNKAKMISHKGLWFSHSEELHPEPLPLYG